MVTVDIGNLATVLGILATLIAGAVTLHKLFRRFEVMENSNAELRHLVRPMCRALWACLDGLNQLGANGEVTKAKADMRDQLVAGIGEEDK